MSNVPGTKPRISSIIVTALLVLRAISPPALSQTRAGAANNGKARSVLRRTKNPVTLTPAQQSVVSKVAAWPEVLNVRVRKEAAVPDLKNPDVATIVMPITGGKDINFVRTRPTRVIEAGVTWRGEVEETGERVVLMLRKDGALSGYFGYNGHIFSIKHLGGGIEVVAEMDRGKLPPVHAAGVQDGAGGPALRDNSTVSMPKKSATPRPASTIAAFPDAERQALEAKKITINLMMLYTHKVAGYYIGGPTERLELSIEDANHTFRNSGLGNISLNLVHSQEIDYDEGSDDHFIHLYRMVDGVGPFKDLKKLRREYHANIVGLILDSPSGCGLSTRIGGEADEAFFVVHHACAAITLSIAHEIGHILGARHDSGVDANNAPFPYGHGYVNGTKWRTMMSYNESCGGCPRIPRWSNPRIMYKGEPTGIAAADNARVILEQAERVSNFR